MAKGYGTIQVKRMRGRLNVIGLGKTPKDQAYIKEVIKLDATEFTDPKFKAQLQSAVEQMLA